MPASRPRVGRTALSLAATSLLILALGAPAARAGSTWTVTSSADTGTGTLRTVIGSAGNGDTVVINPGVNPVLTLGAINISVGLTILGQSARSTSITSNGHSTIFTFNNSSHPTVSMSHLALVNGAGGTTGGGALDVSNARLQLNDVTVSGSTAQNGAGINLGCGGELDATAVTIASNRTTGGIGSALYQQSCDGWGATLTDATITGNTGSPAIELLGPASGFYHDTIAGNPNGNVVISNGAIATFQSTIIANGGASNCSGSGYGTNGGNVEDTSPTQCGLDPARDLIGANPHLGSLANNGGEVDTMAPSPGSPVIDDPQPYCGPNDARGYPRPDNAENNCDAGAVETQDPAPSVTVTCAPNPEIYAAATRCAAAVTGPAGAPAPTGAVTFSSDAYGNFGNGATCTLTAGRGASSSCAVPYTPQALGGHTISASYPGDGYYAPASGSSVLAVNVRPVTFSLSCSPASLAPGATTDCTATADDPSGSSNQPSGYVTFTGNRGQFDSTTCYIGDTTADSCDVHYTPRSAGTQTITAAYAGDSYHASASAVATVVAAVQTPSTLSASCSPATVTSGQSTTCTATVLGSGAPTGTVSFSSTQGSFPFGATCPLHGGSASSCAVTFTPASTSAPTTFGINVSYSGDPYHSPSTAFTSVASPPVPGVSADVGVLQGVVYLVEIKNGQPVLVPLKGQTDSVPVGAKVDTRKGVVVVRTSSDYADPKATQSGQISAGEFEIKQLAAKKALAHHKHAHHVAAFTDVLLLTPKGAVAHAGCHAHGGPGKGIVRQIRITAKGLYHTIGAASTATVNGQATWTVTDRCDGTLTKVTHGTVKVKSSRDHRTVTLGPGQSELVKARFLEVKLLGQVAGGLVLPVLFAHPDGMATLTRRLDLGGVFA